MKPIVICLTPVKNEAWILEQFLRAASLWADHIIIADQMSTDGSREIALKFPKVKLIDNNSKEFNEPERQRLLINEARKIEGPKLLIAIDADEMFTPNILYSNEWIKILNSDPGTIIKFQWANLRPDFKTMWYGYYFPWGYMDNGYNHTETNKIHSGRIPLPENSPILEINEIKLIHSQYLNWKRMKSKHNWYQCYERITFPEKSAIDIFRTYHHMFAVPVEQIVPIPSEWISEYKALGINILSEIKEEKIWFDEKILDFFNLYGINTFKKTAIWEENWKEKARSYGYDEIQLYQDPRSYIDKFIQKWLSITQLNANKYRKIDKLIKFVFKY